MKMNYFLFIFCSIIVLSSCSKEEQINNPVVQHTIELRAPIDICFTTYNIQAFCNGALPPSDIDNISEYTADICNSLRIVDSDVISLQEVWCQEVADILEDCLSAAGYQGITYDYDSGLMTITREEAVSTVVPFQGPEGGGDHFKDKGFIHSEIEIRPGCTISVINTHLQADNSWYEDILDQTFFFLSLFTRHSNTGENLIRLTQLAEIKQYMQDNISSNQLLLLGGDFNIKKNGGPTIGIGNEYENLITLIQGQPSQLVTTVPTNDGGDILDYYLISNYQNFESQIGNITNVVYDGCLENMEVVRYNVFREEILIGSFNTQEEADQLVLESELQDFENNLFSWYIVSQHVTHICRAEIVGDHKLVETCLEDFECGPDCN